MITPLYLYAAAADVREHIIDTLLVDDPQTIIADTQTHPAVFTLDPEPAILQIGQETTFGFIVRMGNLVADHRLLPGYLTNSRHLGYPETFRKERGFYMDWCNPPSLSLFLA